MNDYNDYITAINKIFEYLNKMKTGWNNIDNKNHIEGIEEYKKLVVNSVNLFKTPPVQKIEEKKLELEALSND